MAEFEAPHGDALSAFMARKARIDTLLRDLQAWSHEHFGVALEAVHWGHMGELDEWLEFQGRIAALSRAYPAATRRRSNCHLDWRRMGNAAGRLLSLVIFQAAILFAIRALSEAVHRTSPARFVWEPPEMERRITAIANWRDAHALSQLQLTGAPGSSAPGPTRNFPAPTSSASVGTPAA